jgi:hypothetical protein
MGLGSGLACLALVAGTLAATAGGASAQPGPGVSNSAVVAQTRANPDDGTQFIYVRQADASSTATVTTHLDLNAGYPSVPQQPGTALTLEGRDAKMLLADYSFGGQHLVYSTSELMTQCTSSRPPSRWTSARRSRRSPCRR